MNRIPLLTKATFLFVAFSLVSSCSLNPPSQPDVKLGGPSKLNFIDPDFMEMAADLKPKFKDEDFYGLESEVRIEFFKIDFNERRKKFNDQIEEYEDLLDLIDRVNLDNDVEASLKKKIKKEISTLEKDRDSEHMLTPIGARVIHYNSVLALGDLNSFSDYIFYSKYEDVKNIAVTYNEDANDWFRPSIFDKSMDGDGYFYTDTRVKAFQVLAPARGTKISYTYTLEYENIKYLTSIYFPEGFPLKERNITIEKPDWLDLDLLEMNLEGLGVTKGTSAPRTSKIDDIKSLFKEDNSNDDDGSRSSNRRRRRRRSRRSSSDVTTTNYKLENIRSFPNEPDAMGPSYNVPHLMLVTKSFEDEGEKKPLLKDVNDLYSWYKTLVKEVDNDVDVMAELSEEIVKDAKAETDREKVEAIYYWVQDNVRYIAFEDGIAGFQPDACQKVYKNRYGDCKGMANLTTQLLKAQNLDAHLTWIGTRRIAYDYSVPSIAVDNHMISMVVLEGKRYFLDATEPYAALGDYADRIQGRQVLIENGDTFMIDSIPIMPLERNIEKKVERLKLDGSDLVGTVKDSYKGESKTRIRYGLDNTKSDRKATVVERMLSNKDVNLKVQDPKYDNLNKRGEEIIFDYDLTINNHVLKKDNEVLINAEWDYHYRGMHLDSMRQRDVDLSYKVWVEKETNIELPKGMKAKFIPKAVVVDTEYYKVHLEYKVKGNQLVYIKRIQFPKGSIPVEEVKAWNKTQEALSEFYKAYVVFETK